MSAPDLARRVAELAGVDPPRERKPIPVVADFLQQAKEQFNFAPDLPASDDAYRRAYAQAFPGAPLDIATSELVTGYRDAVEALMQAFHASAVEMRAGTTSIEAAERRSGLVGALLGLPLGVYLHLSGPGGVLENRYDEQGNPRILAMGVYDRKYPANSPVFGRGEANAEFHGMGTTCSVL